jgi:D-3-phosphoglycerate dehydrogenase / 2-oxoglutarate reductase
MLNCLRKIAPQNAKIKKGVWKKEMGNLLKGKKIGLIGFGRIGQRVGQLCMAFGTTVFYYDIQEATNNPCKLITFEELVTQSDVISLHLSGANQVLTSLEFEQMKKGVVIINTSRGSAIDETALANQLKSGKVGFAALDVFSNEPYRGELTQLDNVILTPHIGSYALESRVKMEIQSAEQLIQFLERSHNS